MSAVESLLKYCQTAPRAQPRVMTDNGSRYGDAMNLGWKLAATVRGHASPDLLDSQERERHPVGAQVLDWSRAQVALMRPDAGSRALAAIMRDVIGTRDAATYFAARKAGVSLRYDLGGSHPLVGRSVPDVLLADGRRLGELLRGGRSVLPDSGPTSRSGRATVSGAIVDRHGIRGLMASFSSGVSKDKAAVAAAIESPWSNGQTEGQITKLKLVKRQMYGRAKIDLLEARLVCPP